MTYIFTSLSELADMFDTFANNTEISPLQNTIKERALVAREANTWRRAAQVVRDSRIDVDLKIEGIPPIVIAGSKAKADCQYAKSSMTPCVVRDGSIAWAMDIRDYPVCAGCDRTPETIGVAFPDNWEKTKAKAD